MAKYSNTVEYNIKTTLDQTGLIQLQTQIRQVESNLKILQKEKFLNDKSIDDALKKINEVRTVLNSSFNSKLGLMDNKALITGLNSIQGGINGVYGAFKTGGAQGVAAFNQLYGQITKVDQGLKQVSSTSDKIFNTLGNTVRWGLIASAFANVMNAAHQSVEYVKDLDRSLTNIMMVSGETRDNMNEFARSANLVAQRLGGTTVQMTEATKVFIQQGYSLQQSSQLGEYAVHLANVSEQDSAMASDEITAYMNAFRIPLDDLGNAISKWAAVANATAVDVEELSVASQKAASVAATVGVDLDQFAGHIAAIESVTREAPENIGNGLKTIYSRIADISLGETLEDGVNLGAFAKALEKVGVNVLDQTGKLRDAGTILEDLMVVWQDLDQTQRAAVAKTVAGRFQLARFEALMNRADIYENAANISRNETGTATYDRMQETYRESLEGKSNALTATIEEIFLNAFETDSFYGLIDAVTALTKVFADLIKAVGGGGTALMAMSAILTKVFSKNLGQGISNFIQNRAMESQQRKSKEAVVGDARLQLAGEGLNTGYASVDKAANDIAAANQYRDIASPEQESKVNQLIETRIGLLNEEISLNGELDAVMVAASLSSQQARQVAITDEEQLIQYLQDLKIDMAELSTEDLQILPFKDVYKDAEKAQSIVLKFSKTLDSLRGKDSINEEEWFQLQENAKIAKQELEELKEAGSFAGRGFEDLEQTLRALDEIIVGDSKSFDQLSQEIDDQTLSWENYRSAVERAMEFTDEVRSKNVEGLLGRRAGNRARQENNGAELQGIGDILETQNFASGLATITGDIGQLIFAWQSFQSLGSLIADENISAAEKFGQVLLNLSMSVPMLLSGFSSVKNTLKNIKWDETITKINQVSLKHKELGISTVTAAGGIRQAGAAAVSTAAKESLLGTAARGAAVGVGLLNKALTFMTGPWGMAIMAGLMLIQTAISAVQQAQEQAYSKAKENAENAISNYNSISDKITSFDDLYDKYKETGNVTDELINTSKELIDTLDIEGGATLVAAGRFDLLAESIKEADKAHRSMAERDIESFLAGSNAQSLQGNPLGIGNGSIYEDLIKGMGGRAIYGESGEIQGAASGVSEIEKAQFNNSPAEAIAAARKTIKQYNDEIDGLEADIKAAQGRNEDTSGLERFKNQKLAQIQKINEALDTEDIADYISNLESLSELRVEDLDIQQGAKYQEIVDAFFNDEYIRTYLESLGSWSEQLTWMIQHTSDETAKLELMLEQSYEKTGSLLYNKGKASAESNMIITDQQESSEDIGNAFSQYVLNEVQNSGLSKSQQIKFLATIDETTSINEILKQLQEIKEHPEIAAAEIELKPTLTNRGDVSQDSIDQLLKDTGISENAFSRQSQDIYNSDAFKSRAEELKEDIKAINESNFKDYVENAETAEEATDELKEQLGNLASEAKDTAAINIRLNKGVRDLSKSWEKFGSVLSDDISKGTSDWYEAVAELDEAVSDIVNVDVGSLSNDFYQNEEAINAMQRAAKGEVAAIDELRDLANEDIIMHMDVQNISEEDLANLRQQLIDEGNALQADLNSMPLEMSMKVGAFDDSDYVQHLNQLLLDSQITAEMASNALSSIGMGFDIEYHTGRMMVPQYTYHMEGDLSSLLSGESSADVTVAVIPAGEKEFDAQVPQIVGTHYNGPGVSNVGGSSRPSGSGGKGGGGGGGGGGSKAKTVKKSADIDKSKPAAAENDIYEKVNATLEKLKDSYSKLNKVKDRTWGKGYRDSAQKGLDLLVKEQKTLDKRIDIAKKYADALKTGKSNLAYGIDMTDKESLASLGLKDSDLDGVIDNYISRFEEVRQAARKLDAEAEDYRNKANAEALAYWQSKGGRLDGEGNVVTEATMSEDESEYYSKLVEKQKNHYDKLVEKANEQWELAEKINDVTKDYEDTMNQIRDDEEEQLDLAHEIEDIQIDLYQRSLDMLDTMHDINDIAAQMKGFFTKLATDDPFRALTESAQAFENSFKDATYNATAYYNDIIEKLQKEQAQVKANGGEWEKYNEAIEFYNQQKANAVTNADGLGSGELAQQSRRLTELERWIQNPNAVDNPYGTNTQALYDAYQEQYKKVTDAALEAEERMEAVHESIIEAYDKMAEQQDELVQQYDRVDEQLNRTADRVSLYRGEDAYADQATISKQRAKVALEAGKSSLKALDKYRQQLAKAQEQQELERPQKIAAAEAEVTRLQMALNEDKNNLDLQQQLATAKTVLEQAKYDDSEEIKWLKNQIDETTDYINDKADEAAEHFKDAYENSIDEIAAQTTDKIFGNRDLDLITNDWDWDRDYFGSYKDNVERTLETEKLRLKYLDLLDSAQGSSLGIQRQIKDAMDEQLALLENQKTMSEYDVKLANARLEILQKQIALENAQQNKNQMKLRRDSQGNYKYVYAADQDDIRGKQRELLESEFDAYEMSKDANGDAYQQGIALYQQYIEQRTAIEKKYANDVDTMEKELAKLRENYSRAAEANAEDVQDTYNGMIISVQWMAEHGTEAVQQMTEDVLHALEEKTQESLEAVGIPWNDAIYQGLTDLGNLQQTIDDTSENGINAAKEFVNAINGEGDSVLNLVNAANESMQQSFDDTTESINKAKDATDQLGVATDNLNQKLGAELGAIDEAKAKIASYENELTKARESTSALASQLSLTEEQLANKAKEAEQWKTTYENYKQSIEDEREAAKKKIEEEKRKAAAAQKNGAVGNASTSDIAWGIAQNIWTYGSWGNDPDRHSRISERYGEEVANLTQKYINQYWSTGQLVNYDSDKWGYASGGYTGTWGKDSGLDGNNGKLAFLHQKELVLNQQDTENILEAVQVMRSIMDITKMASLGSSGFDARRISQTAADTIEQRVEITAEFPAANSADDIRQALLGLSDAAMQYAYRER